MVALPHGAVNSLSHLYISSSNYNNHMYFSLALFVMPLGLLTHHLKYVLVIIIARAHVMDIKLIGDASEGF